MKNSRYKEQGVALLFALGVMSLMLVTGVAFLANALISQKIAVNNSSLGQSRLLARSAADRVLMQLMMLERARIVYKDDEKLLEKDPAEYIYSYARTGTETESSKNTSAVNITSDQIGGTTSTTFVNKLDVKNDNFSYGGEQSRAKWIYVHADGSESQGTAAKDSKIIGRYAYQLLPRRLPNSALSALSPLSLYAVTAGESHTANLAVTPASGRVPHKYRWGIDGDELMIPGCGDGNNTMFKYFWGNQTQSGIPQSDFENFIGNLSSPTEAPCVFNSDTKFKKHWLRYWFSEGRGRLTPEAYIAHNGTNFVRLPRFNVGACLKTSTDPWYSRLCQYKDEESTLKNTKEALERLTYKNTIPYDETIVCNGNPHYERIGTKDIDQKYYGLPFLRYIGNNKGSFKDYTVLGNTTLGLEFLRKQIAANFNDYCDSDSCPTSDVPASTWNISNTTKMPKYTGNEKTPYINEIAFGFQLKDPALSSTGSNATLTTGLNAEIIGELIRLYNIDALTDAHLTTELKSLSVKFTISLKGSATVDDAPQPTFFDGGEGHKQPITLTDSISSNNAFSVDLPFSGNATKGYWIARQDISEIFSSKSFDFSTALATELGNGTISNLKIDSINVQVDSITFSFAGMMLALDSLIDQDGDTPKTVTIEQKNVDFVRWPTETITVSLASPQSIFQSSETGDENLFISPSNLAKRNKDAKGIFYLGGIEVKDPRQNLNANKPSETSDWNYDLKMFVSDALPADQDSVNTDTPTIKVQKGKWSDSRLVAGKCNNCSNPSSPSGVSGTAGTDYDKETVTDPAYNAGTGLSTAVIRNAPMKSLWEIGFIHRGAPWQTINLKKAGGFDGAASLTSANHYINNSGWDFNGTDYNTGDAGILDAVKLTDHVKAYTKINLYDLKETAKPSVSGSTATAATWNKYIANALFEGIREQGTAANFLKESLNDVPTTQTGTLLTSPHGDNLSGIDFSKNGTADAPPLRSFMLTQSSDFAAKTTVATVFKTETTDTTDAAKEELIGKTMNLVDVIPAEPVVFKAIIVAQSIRELPQGTAVPGETETATIGKFDIGTNGIDQILGETKMLVTFEKVNYIEKVGTNNEYSSRARLRIRQIEYLD